MMILTSASTKSRKKLTNFQEASKLLTDEKMRAAAENFEQLASHSTAPLEKANFLIEAAECYRQIGEFVKSHERATEAKEHTVADVIALIQIDYFLAVLLITQGKREEGLSTLSSIVKEKAGILANDEEGQKLYQDVQMQRGFTLMHLGLYEDARRLLEECSSFALPNNEKSDVHCHLGHCYFELGLYPLAQVQFQEAASLGISEEWSPTFHFYYAYDLYELREFFAAKREAFLCNQSGTHGPTRSDVYKLLAAIHRKLGEHAQARVYEKSLESR
jgi:tetratricopeptide (TPR) repeat protein